MRKRLEDAKRFTLSEYNEKIAAPLWEKQAGNLPADTRHFIQSGSLVPIIDRLRGNPKVHILHNADDFLVERKSIEALKTVLGDRVRIYPYGGHLGNLWYSENKKYALRYFDSPTK